MKFESRIEEKSKHVVADDPTKRKEAIDFLLQSIPFIKEYSNQGVEGSSPRTPKTSNIDEFVHYVGIHKGKSIMDQYLATVENDREAMARVVQSSGNNQEEFYCEPCNVPFLLISEEATMVCSMCGNVRAYMEGSSRNLSYTESIEHGSSRAYTYKRVSHFIECLNSKQGKVGQNLPEDVIQRVRDEVKKHRISPKDVTAVHVRQFLKRLSLSKHYESTNYILAAINPDACVRLPVYLEEVLIRRFIALQSAWNQYIDSTGTGRKNMLRYNYVVYKLLEMEGEEGKKYLDLFPLLKSPQKIRQHDEVWRQICVALNLEFQPTV